MIVVRCTPLSTCLAHVYTMQELTPSLICIASHDACMSVQLLYIVGHSACAGSNCKACLKCICTCMQIWNFSSGECLKELEGISNQEITGIICLQVGLAAAVSVSLLCRWPSSNTLQLSCSCMVTHLSASCYQACLSHCPNVEQVNSPIYFKKSFVRMRCSPGCIRAMKLSWISVHRLTVLADQFS